MAKINEAKKPFARVKAMRLSSSRLLVVVAISLLKEKEFFDDHHLIRVLSGRLHSLCPDTDSLVINRRGLDPIKILSLEIVRTDEPFTKEELHWIRTGLQEGLLAHVETWVPSIFMPRNEEEVIRNILLLGQELKYIHDLPQVTISFDHQSKTNLFFTVIWVRILKPSMRPLLDHSKEIKSFCRFVFDRVKVVGMLRKRYAKEAIVFRVKFKKDDFIRVEGHSIDLYKARQALSQELGRLFGDFRDYNGGMISKQQEVYIALMHLLKEEKINATLHLIDHLFYSVTPTIFQTLIDPHYLKIELLLIKECLKLFHRNPCPAILVKKEDKVAFLAMAAADKTHFDDVEKAVKKIEAAPLEIAKIDFDYHDVQLLGYILISENPALRERLFAIQKLFPPLKEPE